jgi:hypothetical protein
LELLLVNARHIKILPGRKTDVGDAAPEEAGGEGMTSLDLPEWVELVRAVLPEVDRPGSSRNWTRRWTRRDQAGTCGRSARSSRPGIGWCSPAGTAGRGGQRPRLGWAAATSLGGRPRRLGSRARSAAT